MKNDTVVTILTVIATSLIAITMTGCAGAGIEGRLGLYREDSRSQQSRTYDKPLKCLFVNCGQEAEQSGS